MTNTTPLALDFAPFWGRLNDGIIRLVDYIPDDKIDWSPKPELWNFKGTLIHIIWVRHAWLENDVKDGVATPNVLVEAQTREAIKEHLGTSWNRVERFLTNREQLDATYHNDENRYETYSGHWIAYHLLEHDIHHRADIFHYLALLEIEHPDVGTP
jgi:uncharacterized damage-inducible protein DinB